MLMKLISTGSAAITTEYQIFLKLHPVTYAIDINTAEFLGHFAASKNCIPRLDLILACKIIFGRIDVNFAESYFSFTNSEHDMTGHSF